MGKTKDLFKKIRDTKGTFHAKIGTIKGRNCMDLTEAEDIKKSGKQKIIYREDEVDIGSLVRGENFGLNTASSAST